VIDFLVSRFDVNPDFIRLGFWGGISAAVGVFLVVVCMVAMLIGFAVMGGWLIDAVR
jgi:hypothetical protein